MPYKLVKRIYKCWLDYSLRSWLTRRKPGSRRYQKVFTISSGCARHIPVYVYISVKESRVGKPCNVLTVRKYVRASMV